MVKHSMECGTHILYDDNSEYSVQAVSMGKHLDFNRMWSSVYAIQSFVKVHNHCREKNWRRHCAIKNPEGITIVYISQDHQIAAHSNKTIGVTAELEGSDEWVIERNLIPHSSTSYLVAPNTLISKTNLVVAVSNPTDTLKFICKGDTVDIAQKMNDFFSPINEPETMEKVHQVSLLINKLSENESVEEAEENVSKTAYLPDPHIYPSLQIWELLDIRALPETLTEEAWKMLESHSKAFGFNGRLGNYPIKARIWTIDGVSPVSLPVYASSPAKWEVIDKQINSWYTQGVIEPSKSPWGASVVIVYRNGKPQFCVDYCKLNSVTIPDEFPIPRQTDILAETYLCKALRRMEVLCIHCCHEPSLVRSWRIHPSRYNFVALPLQSNPPPYSSIAQFSVDILIPQHHQCDHVWYSPASLPFTQPHIII